MRYTDDDNKTIRQLLGESLRAFENELALIRESLEIMKKTLDYKSSGGDLLNYQVATLSEQVQELERRMIAIEKHSSMESWVYRQIISGIVVLTIVYTANWLA